MDKVKGYDKLSEVQKRIFTLTYNRHQGCLGTELKKEYEAVRVAPLSPMIIKVWFKNKTWLHYNSNFDWY